MSAEEIEKGLIGCFKNPDVVAIIKEQLLAPLVQQAVNEAMVPVMTAMAAKDQEICRLKSELSRQKQETNDLEQYSRKNCLTISGLPDRQNETVSETVTELARAVGVELLPTDIDTAHRIGAPNRNRPRPVIVKLVRFDKRQELYAARKRVKNANLSRASPGRRLHSGQFDETQSGYYVRRETAQEERKTFRDLVRCWQTEGSCHS